MPTTVPPDADRPLTAVTVEQLDSIEQARLWHELGPVEATRTLVGAIRAALLIDDVVEVDRNELFDGVFFLMTPPDRLRWHLGLEPGARLPIRVAILDAPTTALDATALDVRVPVVADAAWRTAETLAWGIEGAAVAQVVANVLALSAPGFVSSAHLGLTGTYRTEAAVTCDDTVLLGRTSAAWQQDADTVVVPGRVWAAHDHVVAHRVVEEGRLAWARAVIDGQLALGRRAHVDLELSAGFDRWQPTDPTTAALAQELARLEVAPSDASRLSPCTRRHSWDVEADGTSRVCGRRHVLRRSEIVRRLDALADAPDAADLPLLSKADPATRQLAFRWWNQVYRDALLAGTAASSTVGVVPGTSANPDHEVAWRLREPSPGRWTTAWARIRGAWAVLRARLQDGWIARRGRSLRSEPHGDPARSRKAGALGARRVVEGEVIAVVLNATPYDYARLHSSTRHLRTGARGRRRQTELAALALEIRDQGRPMQSIAKRRRSQAWRMFLAFAIFVPVTVLEQVGDVVGIAAVIAIVLSAPWGPVIEALSLTRGRLQATLRVREA